MHEAIFPSHCCSVSPSKKHSWNLHHFSFFPPNILIVISDCLHSLNSLSPTMGVNNTFHIAMYPWFALGHLTSYLHISNNLAERGHRISFHMPRNTISKVEPFNLHPDLIFFIPITIPHVDGLPIGSETTAELHFSLHSLLMTAMDLTEPALANKISIKALHYCTISPATVEYVIRLERKLHQKSLTKADLRDPPPSFPPTAIRLQPHEARGLATATVKDYGKGVSFMERQLISFTSCDASVFKTCKEMEGPYCDYLESQMRKQVLLAEPVLPDPPTSSLKSKWKLQAQNSDFLCL